MQSICSFDPCSRRVSCKGFCGAHYQQARLGKPLAELQKKHLGPLRERLLARVDTSGECWLWSGPLMANGYAAASWQGRKQLVHRLSWLTQNGPIPDGLVIDHICHTRHCIRPDHLQAVTQKQNLENYSAPQPSNTSGVRGVSWDKSRQRWAAGLKHNGRRIALGRFDRLADAAEAVRSARNALHTNNLKDRSA